MMVTVHNIFIDSNKKEEFQNVITKVNRRLKKLLQDEERKAMRYYPQRTEPGPLLQ